MDMRVIEDRLRQYKPASKLEELNALKEIAQEITLLALSRAEFFKQAAFQGGTCLRIVYGLPRFSEDLDFILFTPDTSFAWRRYLHEIQLEFESFGLTLEIKDRSQASSAVKKAFIKENSFGKILQLAYERNSSDVQVIQIKLEVDTNPPMGSDFETKIVDFPTPFSITTQTEPSLFAGKLHALLCREYVKGRDWFDFVWYVTRRTPFNPMFLQQALFQQGPWIRKSIEVSLEWVKEQLQKKVRSIDWKVASMDVEILLKSRELQSLSYWNVGFFEHYIERLEIFQKKENNLSSDIAPGHKM